MIGSVGLWMQVGYDAGVYSYIPISKSFPKKEEKQNRENMTICFKASEYWDIYSKNCEVKRHPIIRESPRSCLFLQISWYSWDHQSHQGGPC